MWAGCWYWFQSFVCFVPVPGKMTSTATTIASSEMCCASNAASWTVRRILYVFGSREPCLAPACTALPSRIGSSNHFYLKYISLAPMKLPKDRIHCPLQCQVDGARLHGLFSNYMFNPSSTYVQQPIHDEIPRRRRARTEILLKCIQT